MITLKITFLLALIRDEETKRRSSKVDFPKNIKDRQKIKKKSNTFKSTASAQSEKSEKDTITWLNKNTSLVTSTSAPVTGKEGDVYFTIAVKSPITYLHLDYDLFHKKIKYSVDVICWGPAAKIFTKDGTKSVRTLTRGGMVWVPVFLEHYFNYLSTEELRKLLAYNITLHIAFGRKYVGAKAKSDKSLLFFLHTSDAGNEFFPEVFTKIPKNFNEHQITRMTQQLLLPPFGHEVITWMYNTDDVHSYKVGKIVTKRSIGKEISCKDIFKEESTKQDKTIARNIKKNRRTSISSSYSTYSGRSAPGTKLSTGSAKSTKLNEIMEFPRIEFKIPAHILLNDSDMTTYRVRNNGGKFEIYILLSSDNMLTLAQKIELSPLVVNIRKISNLPEDVLKQNGFTHVFASCNIPGILEFKTFSEPVGPKLHFDESRFIITKDFPAVRIKQMLQTSGVRVKIFGLKEKPKDTTPLKSSSKNKKSKKKDLKMNGFSSKSVEDDKTNPETLLAVATFDLSSLSKINFSYKEKGQCYSSNSLLNAEKVHILACLVDRLTTNEINFCSCEEHPPSPLENPVLFEKCTTLKFEAHFLKPNHPAFSIENVGGSYKRILMILFKRDVAALLLSAILLNNHEFYGPGPLVTPHFLTTRKLHPDSASHLEEQNKILTGFFIDDGNNFVLFIEGPSNGYILTILHHVSKLNNSAAKIFYNTDHVFEEREYEILTKFSGLILMELKLPLIEILAQGKIYVKGNMPINCFKAIQKLDLIFRTDSFKTVLNDDLLPTIVELLSLSMEFGVQVRYKRDNAASEGSLFETWTSNPTSKIDFFGTKMAL